MPGWAKSVTQVSAFFFLAGNPDDGLKLVAQGTEVAYSTENYIVQNVQFNKVCRLHRVIDGLLTETSLHSALTTQHEVKCVPGTFSGTYIASEIPPERRTQMALCLYFHIESVHTQHYIYTATRSLFNQKHCVCIDLCIVP